MQTDLFLECAAFHLRGNGVGLEGQILTRVSIKLWVRLTLETATRSVSSIPPQKGMPAIDTVAWVVLPSRGLPHNHAHPARSNFTFPAPFLENLFLLQPTVTIAPTNHAQVLLK